MPRYFFTYNVKQPLVVDGRKIEFEPIQFSSATNSWWGTLAVDDEGLASLLNELVKVKRVEEITAEDFEKFEVKKKTESGLMLSTQLPDPLATPKQPGPIAQPAAAKPVVSVEDVILPKPGKKK